MSGQKQIPIKKMEIIPHADMRVGSGDVRHPLGSS